MDDRRFDSLVKSLSNGGSRRGVMQTLGAGALAAVAARLGLADEAEAKKKKGKNKKKKKCKGNTRKCNGKCIPQDNCCVDGDCEADQKCEGGQCVIKRSVECKVNGDCAANEICQNGDCVADGNQDECEVNGDCLANEICLNGKCLCAFPNKPCGDLCCASDEACVDGQCVVGQGTCAAGQSICDEVVVFCNGNSSCNCADRLDDGEPRCIQFLNDTRANCTCTTDFQCEVDFPNQGAICIKGGDSCQCGDADRGRCARLCPGSN